MSWPAACLKRSAGAQRFVCLQAASWRAGRRATRSTAGSCSTSRSGWARRRPSAACAACSAPRRPGHGGTLDPLASGVLPIALGRGDQDRAVRHGRPQGIPLHPALRRGALDRGCARARSRPTSDVRPTDAGDPRRPGAFIGEIEQMPPAFSALKIDGQRAYDLARAGEAVEMKSRRVRIDRLELLARPDSGPCRFGGRAAARAPISGPWGAIWRSPWAPSDTCRRCVGRPPDRSGKRRPFRFPNWRPSGIFPRSSGPWLPLRPRWTTSRRWP